MIKSSHNNAKILRKRENFYMKFLLPALLIIFIFTGCGGEEIISKPPLVKVEKVKYSSAQKVENYSGVVKGRYETNLSFQVEGKIISRNVQVGENVESGEILMTIDPKDIFEQNQSADAQVQAAFAKKNLAESNLKRYSELYKENAVAAATLEQYQTEYDAAVADYNSAVAQAEQNKNSLDYTKLLANADGVISKISAEVGQVVSAGQNVLTLVQTNELEVETNIPENKISEVQIGQQVTVNFWANNKILSGRVREISPIADNNSRTFSVRISLENFSSENIQLGMTANVSIAEKNSVANDEIVLPISAIYQTGKNPQVWVVRNNKVELQNISATDFDKNSVKVRGLSAGDVVVVAGIHKLREGLEVRTGAE